MKKHFILSAILAAGTLTAAVGTEAATFKTPKNYNVIIADGAKTSGFFTDTRELELSEGRHQIVVMFKGSFKKGHDKLIASAVNPVVINLPDVKKDDAFTFTYPRISGYDEAVDYADRQVITITRNGARATEDEASYIILKSDKGFQLDRDFIGELKSLDLLYVSEKNREQKKDTVQELTKCRDSFTDCPTEVVVSSENVVAVSEKTASAAGNAGASAAKAAEVTSGKSSANVNTQMLEGLKSIYSSADPDTRKAFREWIKNN